MEKSRTPWAEPALPWVAIPVPEYPDPTLNDIAATHLDGWGNYFILYNPANGRAAGPLVSDFFRAHEYAHVAHRDSHRYGSSPSPEIAIAVETEADRYATDVWALRNPAVLDAAEAFFFNAGHASDGMHPSGIERSQNIAARRRFIADAVTRGTAEGGGDAHTPVAGVAQRV